MYSASGGDIPVSDLCTIFSMTDTDTGTEVTFLSKPTVFRN